MFSSIAEFKNDDGCKYTPLEVAQWLEDLADEAERNLSRIPSPKEPALRRLTADAAIQAGLGRFFAWKIRAAVLWSIEAGDAAVKAYKDARKAWVELAERAKGVYVADISYGPQPHLRGHWLDRLPAIDADIADMERARQPGGMADPDKIAKMLARPQRPAIACHIPPAHFRPGQPLEIALSFAKTEGSPVRLFYRHVNQSELWRSAEMHWRDEAYRAAIPGDYTRSPYPLQYYFTPGKNIYPGFNPNHTGLPYFVVRSS
jgi:hypothetical protein